MICKNCKSEVFPKMKGRGSSWVELTLWLIPLILYGLFYLHSVAKYDWTFEQFVNAIDEIDTIGSAQPAYLNYNPDLIELYNLNKAVETSFSIWIIAAGYTLWQFFTRKRTCPICREANCFVPKDTPEGMRISAEFQRDGKKGAVDTGGLARSNLTANLEKLNELKQKGVLSNEEFETAKKKLFST